MEKNNPNIYEHIFDLQAFSRQFSQASTFLVFTIDQINPEQQSLHEEYMNAFNEIIPIKSSSKFRQISLNSAKLYIKQLQNLGNKIRIIYFPFKTYQIKELQQGKQNVQQLMRQHFLYELFLKPQLCKELKIVSITFLGDGQVKGRSSSKKYNLKKIIDQNILQIQKKFKIFASQFKQKIKFLLVKDLQKKNFVLSQNNKVNQFQIFALTSSQDQHPFNIITPGLEQNSGSLETYEKSKFFQEGFIKIKDVYKVLKYNRFLNMKNQIKKGFSQRSIPDLIKEVTNVLNILFEPISIITSKILLKILKNIYKQQNISENFKIDNANNSTNIPEVLSNFNSLFNSNAQIDKSFFKNLKHLNQFTQQFKKYSDFKNNGQQDKRFYYSMICSHVNYIVKQMQKIKGSTILKQSEKEKYLLQFYLIIIKFLKTLKQMNLFENILTHYKADLYQSLTYKLVQSYQSICQINGQSYCKFSHLFEDLSKLKTKSSDLWIITQKIKEINLSQSLQSQNKSNVLEINQIMNKVMLQLLSESKPDQKNIKYTQKQLRTKFSLAKTYYHLALAKDESDDEDLKQNTQRLKLSLKILDNILTDLQTNSAAQIQIIKNLNFNQRQVLQLISGVLKCLNRLDLSIQIQKKLNVVNNVYDYYNRWMYQYNRFDPKLNQIIKEAIKYFKTKFECQKVQNLYNKLIKNCKSSQQKQKNQNEKFDYIDNLGDKDERKKYINNARTVTFELKQQVREKIKQIYSSPLNKAA